MTYGIIYLTESIAGTLLKMAMGALHAIAIVILTGWALWWGRAIYRTVFRK